MTVKELLETNACIVEVYITLRGDYQKSVINGKREFSDSVYVHELAIGRFASLGRDAATARRGFGQGERGRRFKAPYTIINKELNSRATQQYWAVKTNVIPKDVLDLEVGQWSAKTSYNWRHNQSQNVGYESATEVSITVYLPAESEKGIRIECEEKPTKQIEGQMNLLTMI